MVKKMVKTKFNEHRTPIDRPRFYFWAENFFVFPFCLGQMERKYFPNDNFMDFYGFFGGRGETGGEDKNVDSK